jgi:hypothetical protein
MGIDVGNIERMTDVQVLLQQNLICLKGNSNFGALCTLTLRCDDNTVAKLQQYHINIINAELHFCNSSSSYHMKSYC